MKFNYDRDADAIYIYLSSEKYSYGEDIDEDRRIDYSSSNRPIGIELLSVSNGVNLDSLPKVNEIKEFLIHEGITTYKMSYCTYSRLYGINNITFNIELMPLGYEQQEQPIRLLNEEVTV